MKETPRNTDLHPVGTKIWYTGDMANHSGAGVVESIRENTIGRSMNVVIKGEYDRFTESWTKDRKFQGLTMAHFSPGPGRRFWTRTEWEEDRAVKLAALRQATRH